MEDEGVGALHVEPRERSLDLRCNGLRELVDLEDDEHAMPSALAMKPVRPSGRRVLMNGSAVMLGGQMWARRETGPGALHDRCPETTLTIPHRLA